MKKTTARLVRQAIVSDPSAIYDANVVLVAVWAKHGLTLTQEQMAILGTCPPVDTVTRTLSRERNKRRQRRKQN